MKPEQAIKILDRETSIDAVSELQFQTGFSREGMIELIQEAMDMGADALKKLTWIPCRERLPEKEGAYLLTVKTASGIRYVRMGLLYSNGKFADRNVIAWMPFPPPYQEGESNEIIKKD